VPFARREPPEHLHPPARDRAQAIDHPSEPHMRTLSAALLLSTLVATPVVASRAQTTKAAPTPAAGTPAAHPDFSGTWVLDTARSDKGQMAPTQMTLEITQTATGLTLDRDQTNQMGQSTATLKYALDGTTSTNQLNFGGNTLDISTVVTWEGESQVLTSSMKLGDNDAQSVEKWTLGDGGKSLTLDRKFDVGGQSFASKVVLVKQ
jgi:hypothetical protein